MGSFAVGRYTLGKLKGRWVAFWWEQDGDREVRRRVRLTASDFAEAKIALAAFQAEQDRLNVVHAKSMTDLFNAYIEDREKKGKPTRNPHDSWKQLRPHFGARPVIDMKVQDAEGNMQSRGRTVDISTEHCLSYAKQRKADGVSAGTIWTELTMLRTMCNWAAKKVNPPLIDAAPYITIPPKPAPKERWLTQEEASALIQAAKMHHVRLFIILALSTAGRAGAILDLTWDRVDFEGGTIKLRNPELGETRKGRAEVPLNGMSRPALLEARAGAQTPLVIEWNGEKVLKIRKGFESAVKRAGLGEDVTPHVLRHTAAVWMAQAGVSMSEISQYLGHSNEVITAKVYARFSPQHLAKAAEALVVRGLNEVKPDGVTPFRRRA